MTLPPDPKEDSVDDVADLETEDAPESDVEESDGTDGDDGEGSEDAADDVSGDAEEGDEVEDEPAPKKRTASDVVRENKRNRKEAERRAREATEKADAALRRAEAAERRAEEAERAATTRSRAETEQAEAARLELMSESEKIAYYRDKDRREYDQKLGGVEFRVFDSTDRMEFRQLAKDDTLVAKVKDEVEAEYERIRASGRPVVPRAVLADLFVGRMVRKNRPAAAKEQRERAKTGVRRETVKAPKTRSGTESQRQRRDEGDTREARRKRLEDVNL